MLTNAARALALGGTLLFRSFEASLEEAPFDRSLVPSRDAVLTELGDNVSIQEVRVADEYSAYMKKDMRLLTVRAIRRGS